MSNSLQDQLLKAGLVTEKKVKQHKRSQKKQAKQLPKGQVIVDETAVAAQQSREALATRDRERNRELQEVARVKAIRGQIRQMIEVNRIDRSGGDQSYQFAYEGKIKKIFVRREQHEQLARGQTGIARLDDRFEIIPAPIAQKIRERDEGAVLVLNEKQADKVDGDDPYADYPIPDDLMW